MKNMERRPPLTPEEQTQDQTSNLLYGAVYESAKAQGIIGEDVTLEDFRKMKLGDVMQRLKEKGINQLEIKL